MVCAALVRKFPLPDDRNDAEMAVAHNAGGFITCLIQPLEQIRISCRIFGDINDIINNSYSRIPGDHHSPVIPSDLREQGVHQQYMCGPVPVPHIMFKRRRYMASVSLRLPPFGCEADFGPFLYSA